MTNAKKFQQDTEIDCFYSYSKRLEHASHELRCSYEAQLQLIHYYMWTTFYNPIKPLRQLLRLALYIVPDS